MGFLFWGKKKKKENIKEEIKIEEKVVEEKKEEPKVAVEVPAKGEIKEKKEKNVTTKKTTVKKTASAKKVTVKPASENKATKKEIEIKKEEKTTEDKATRMAPSKKVYHVSLRKDDGKWQVKYGGGKKAIKLFDTQAEAIKFAESRADSQDGYISIHKKDGKIRKQDYSKKVEGNKTEEK